MIFIVNLLINKSTHCCTPSVQIRYFMLTVYSNRPTVTSKLRISITTLKTAPIPTPGKHHKRDIWWRLSWRLIGSFQGEGRACRGGVKETPFIKTKVNFIALLLLYSSHFCLIKVSYQRCLAQRPL